MRTATSKKKSSRKSNSSTESIYLFREIYEKDHERYQSILKIKNRITIEEMDEYLGTEFAGWYPFNGSSNILILQADEDRRGGTVEFYGSIRDALIFAIDHGVKIGDYYHRWLECVAQQDLLQRGMDPKSEQFFENDARKVVFNFTPLFQSGYLEYLFSSRLRRMYASLHCQSILDIEAYEKQLTESDRDALRKFTEGCKSYVEKIDQLIDGMKDDKQLQKILSSTNGSNDEA